MSEKILITGATGTIGKSLLANLIASHPDSEIHILTRGQKIKKNYPKNVTIHICNLKEDSLGVTSHEYADFINSISHIVHLAAATRFNLPLDEIREINVASTEAVLKLASKCKKIKRVIHVSTAFVSGKRTGEILEDELFHDSGFLNTYEQSKYEAEEVAESFKDKIPLVIARPSVVIDKIGKSDKGPMNAVFLAIFLAKKGFLPILPGNGSYKVDMIGVEDVSYYLHQLLFKENFIHFRFHITNPQGAIPIEELLTLTLGHTQVEYFGSMDRFETELERRVRFRPDLKYYYTKTEPYLKEIAYPKSFKNEHLVSEFPATRQWTDIRGILKTI